MKRAGNLLLVLAMITAVIASFMYLGLDLFTLGSHDNLTQMGRYALRFMSPDLSSEHLQAIGKGALETLAMSDRRATSSSRETCGLTQPRSHCSLNFILLS